jgi:glucosylglycerol 3-phosphatase
MERLKPAVECDVGTTDIQFMLSGSIKEAGLLVLLNHYMARRYGEVPFGDDFNVRVAPQTHDALLKLVQDRIPASGCHCLWGWVTRSPPILSADGATWLRGGSDRGFLTLLQALGAWSGRENRVVVVDSSHGEVDRPSLSDPALTGISDPEDPLRLDVLMTAGPKQYINWFCQLAAQRSPSPATI